MKKMVLVAALAATVVAPTAIAGETVTVQYFGNEKIIDVGDVRKANVCDVKRQIARMFGLNMSEFFITAPGGTKLRENYTLYSSGVYSGGNIYVESVAESNQCT